MRFKSLETERILCYLAFYVIFNCIVNSLAIGKVIKPLEWEDFRFPTQKETFDFFKKKLPILSWVPMTTKDTFRADVGSLNYCAKCTCHGKNYKIQRSVFSCTLLQLQDLLSLSWWFLRGTNYGNLKYFWDRIPYYFNYSECLMQTLWEYPSSMDYTQHWCLA